MVDDLARVEMEDFAVQRLREGVSKRFESTQGVAAELPQYPADLDRKADGVRHDGRLELSAGHRMFDGGDHAAHRCRHATDVAFEYGRRIGRKCCHVAGVVECDGGGRCDSGDGIGHHLRFRQCPAHAVAVDNRYSSLGRRNQRDHGVCAADLERHDRIHLAADVFFKRLQRLDRIVGGREQFEAHGRCADAADGRHPGVVVHVVDLDQFDGPGPPQHLQRREIRRVGVASAAGGQEHRARGKIFQRFVTQLHDARLAAFPPVAPAISPAAASPAGSVIPPVSILSASAAISPTTFTRSLVVLPAM